MTGVVRRAILRRGRAAGVARRARANTEDLTAYFASRQRAEEVDDWWADRVSALGVQADARRTEHVRRRGMALAAMQSRRKR